MEGGNKWTAKKNGLDIPGKEWELYWLAVSQSCGDCKILPGWLPGWPWAGLAKAPQGVD